MLKYHNITKNDMVNGEGLRVVLWLSGCEHHCKKCHNEITWDKDIGIELTKEIINNEIYSELKRDYVNGITFSGGDPLASYNRVEVLELIKEIKLKFPNKSIWVYTGFKWEDIKDLKGIENVDVICDGKFIFELKQNDLKWVGSKNQRVINVKESLNKNMIIVL